MLISDLDITTYDTLINKSQSTPASTTSSTSVGTIDFSSYKYISINGKTFIPTKALALQGFSLNECYVDWVSNMWAPISSTIWISPSGVVTCRQQNTANATRNVGVMILGWK